MLLIAGGVLALLVFVRLSLRAETGDNGAFQMAWLEALTLSLLGSLGTFGSLVLSALKCDESCDEGVGQWWHTTDAWQWPALSVFAIAGFAALLLTLVLTLRRRHRAAIASVVTAAFCFAAWTALLAPLGNEFGI